jgi:histidyl-tRNA synthetase
MTTSQIERVRGTVDVLPPEQTHLQHVERRMAAVFAAFGYQPLGVPVIEHTELFLRKSGEELAARLFAFTFRNRRICLRPELTASIMRAYVNALQNAPLPLRLSYGGPVFRYEKPQRGRYRQFTQVGVELIGAAGPLADAEVIGLACETLRAVGLTTFRVILGHIGVIAALLEHLRLDERIRSYLLAHLDEVGEETTTQILGRLAELYPTLTGASRPDAALWDMATPQPSAELLTLLAELGEERARLVVRELLASIGLRIETGGRSADEIVTRLVAKLSHEDQTPRVRTALAFIAELREARGSPPEVFHTLRELLKRHGLSAAPLAEVEAIVGYLRSYGVAPDQIVVDLSLARGLEYYTGAIFEIYHRGWHGDDQVCGGGRYDDLVRALGGRRDVPACGFAFGLERVRAALLAEGQQAAAPEPPDILVAPVTEADAEATILLARWLRSCGLVVELDVRARGPRAALQHADSTGIPFVALIGEDEARSGSVRLRDMAERAERLVPLDDLVATLTGACAIVA